MKHLFIHIMEREKKICKLWLATDLTISHAHFSSQSQFLCYDSCKENSQNVHVLLLLNWFLRQSPCISCHVDNAGILMILNGCILSDISRKDKLTSTYCFSGSHNLCLLSSAWFLSLWFWKSFADVSVMTELQNYGC